MYAYLFDYYCVHFFCDIYHHHQPIRFYRTLSLRAYELASPSGIPFGATVPLYIHFAP